MPAVAAPVGGIGRAPLRAARRGGFEQQADRLDEHRHRHLFLAGNPALEAFPVDVQRIAQKYIQPDRLAVIVVGDRKTIEPGIRALNLGTITPLAIEEIFK